MISEVLIEFDYLLLEQQQLTDLRDKALAVVDSLDLEAELVDITELQERLIYQANQYLEHVYGYELLLKEINQALLELVA